MKMIVDLPEKVVEQARAYGDFPYDDYIIIAAQAIMNGIELPNTPNEIHREIVKILEGDKK